MRNTKTARGSIIDMSALAAKHETTRAVGNVPMNARGDRLNQDGSIKVKAEDIPTHDVLLAGFPCQPFSIAGVSKNNSLGRAHGFMNKAQGTLFFDILRILKYHKYFLKGTRNQGHRQTLKRYLLIC